MLVPPPLHISVFYRRAYTMYKLRQKVAPSSSSSNDIEAQLTHTERAKFAFQNKLLSIPVGVVIRNVAHRVTNRKTNVIKKLDLFWGSFVPSSNTNLMHIHTCTRTCVCRQRGTAYDLSYNHIRFTLNRINQWI